MTAQRELTDLLQFSIEIWIERYWYFSRWRYHRDVLQGQIQGCIRRYRFTGSFINYLFVTLTYSAHGLSPIKTYSLDVPVFADRETTWADSVVQDAETGEIKMYGW